MAVSLTCPHPRLDAAQTSLSCASKVYVRLRVQSPNCLGFGKSNVNAEFHNKVYKSLESSNGSTTVVVTLYERGQQYELCTDIDYVMSPAIPFRVLYPGSTIYFGSGKATRARVTMMPIGTPRVPYRNPTEGTWHWVDLWNALYRERVVFIGQHIDEEFSNQILASMLYLDSVDDSKKLFMYINGPGGDLTPSLAIYDTMQSLKSPVITHCVGFAYNLAGFLLAAGEKGNRFAMPLSRIALQSPAGAARGQADDIRNEADELLRIRDYLFKELAQKTGQPIEKVYQDLSRVKRFDAQQALEYGLIDKIARPPRVQVDDGPKKDTNAGLG